MTDYIGWNGSVGYRDVGSGGAYSTISEAATITPPAAEQEWVESTHLTSTNKVRTYIAGMVSPGDWSFEFNYQPSMFATIKALQGSTKEFIITLPDGGSTLVFDSGVTKVEMSQLSFELIKVNVMCRVNDTVDFTAI